ncbi:MAG: hypothetical protein GH151_06990 [Bacteroidetes bacterium]|nr:hypothetical protein [Bacteroidota bacterium]
MEKDKITGPLGLWTFPILNFLYSILSLQRGEREERNGVYDKLNNLENKVAELLENTPPSSCINKRGDLGMGGLQRERAKYKNPSEGSIRRIQR